MVGSGEALGGVGGDRGVIGVDIAEGSQPSGLSNDAATGVVATGGFAEREAARRVVGGAMAGGGVALDDLVGGAACCVVVGDLGDVGGVGDDGGVVAAGRPERGRGVAEGVGAGGEASVFVVGLAGHGAIGGDGAQLLVPSRVGVAGLGGDAFGEEARVADFDDLAVGVVVGLGDDGDSGAGGLDRADAAATAIESHGAPDSFGVDAGDLLAGGIELGIGDDVSGVGIEVAGQGGDLSEAGDVAGAAGNEFLDGADLGRIRRAVEAEAAATVGIGGAEELVIDISAGRGEGFFGSGVNGAGDDAAVVVVSELGFFAVADTSEFVVRTFEIGADFDRLLIGGADGFGAVGSDAGIAARQLGTGHD